MWHYLRDPKFSLLIQCRSVTDTQTHVDGIYRTSIASRRINSSEFQSFICWCRHCHTHDHTPRRVHGPCPPAWRGRYLYMHVGYAHPPRVRVQQQCGMAGKSLFASHGADTVTTTDCSLTSPTAVQRASSVCAVAVMPLGLFQCIRIH